MSRGRWAIDDRHMDRERREDLDCVSLKGGKSKRGGNRNCSVAAERRAGAPRFHPCHQGAECGRRKGHHRRGQLPEQSQTE
ncbi:hypothetical protein FKM82_019323 [Ascaphus truei]